MDDDQRAADYDAAFACALADASRVVEALGEDAALNVAALERYARACADAALLRTRWRRRGSPTLSTGSQGQSVVHPMIEGIRKAEREAAELAERLGLTPSARASIGRRRGGRAHHRAPDRKAEMIRLVKPEREGST